MNCTQARLPEAITLKFKVRILKYIDVIIPQDGDIKTLFLNRKE